MQIEIDDVEIEAKAKAILAARVGELIKEHFNSYQVTQALKDRIKQLANSCLDKVAFDLIEEVQPRMREDVQAAYQAMIKAKAARMMRELEKGQA